MKNNIKNELSLVENIIIIFIVIIYLIISAVIPLVVMYKFLLVNKTFSFFVVLFLLVILFNFFVTVFFISFIDSYGNNKNKQTNK